MTASSTDRRSIEIEREFAHPPERVWRALTQPHLIREWLMENDFVPAIGHRFSLSGSWGGSVECEVTELDPLRRLSYSLNHVHSDPAFDLRSVVEFSLTPTATGTRLTVTQHGFLPSQRQAYGGAKIGWPRFLEKLDALLDRNHSAASAAS